MGTPELGREPLRNPWKPGEEAIQVSENHLAGYNLLPPPPSWSPFPLQSSGLEQAELGEGEDFTPSPVGDVINTTDLRYKDSMKTVFAT